MTQADPSMADLFGDESDAEDGAQSTTQPAAQPDAAAELNTTQQPAISERDLFGSDDEDEEADADDGASAGSAADPYHTRRGSAVLDLEQQLAEVDEDGSALDEDAANAAADEQATEAKAEESQERKRDKALAKRKKGMSKGEDDDDGDNDSTTSSQPDDEEPSRASSNRKSKPSSSSSPSSSARLAAAPVTASGPPLSLLSSPAVPFGAAARLHLVRLPNVIGVQAKAFHADTYEEEAVAEEEEETVGQGKLLEGARKKSKAVSLMVENVIRWREARDEGEGGAVRRESNTRLVRWSDGTSSLLIGGECFDVVQSTADPHRNYVYLQHTAVQASEPDDMSDSPPHSQPRTRPLLRSVGAFTGHIKFKVTGIDSSSHRKLKDVLFETHTKKARIVMDYNEINPEKLRQEEQKQQQQEDKKRRGKTREKGGGGGRRSGGMQYQASGEDDMADFLEEDDDNPSEKARRRKGDYEADVARLRRAKEGADEEDRRGAADYEAEGDEEEAEEDEGGELDVDAILGKKRTASRAESAEGGEAAAEGDATVAASGRPRAEDVDDDLVLHGASKRRRVLADDEESD